MTDLWTNDELLEIEREAIGTLRAAAADEGVTEEQRLAATRLLDWAGGIRAVRAVDPTVFV